MSQNPPRFPSDSASPVVRQAYAQSRDQFTATLPPPINTIDNTLMNQIHNEIAGHLDSRAESAIGEDPVLGGGTVLVSGAVTRHEADTAVRLARAQILLVVDDDALKAALQAARELLSDQYSGVGLGVDGDEGWDDDHARQESEPDDEDTHDIMTIVNERGVEVGLAEEDLDVLSFVDRLMADEEFQQATRELFETFGVSMRDMLINTVSSRQGVPLYTNGAGSLARAYPWVCAYGEAPLMQRHQLPVWFILIVFAARSDHRVRQLLHVVQQHGTAVNHRHIALAPGPSDDAENGCCYAFAGAKHVTPALLEKVTEHDDLTAFTTDPLKLGMYLGYTLRPFRKRRSEHKCGNVSEKVAEAKRFHKSITFPDPIDLPAMPRRATHFVEHALIAGWDTTRHGGYNTNAVDRLRLDATRFSQRDVSVILAVFSEAFVSFPRHLLRLPPDEDDVGWVQAMRPLKALLSVADLDLPFGGPSLRAVLEGRVHGALRAITGSDNIPVPFRQKTPGPPLPFSASYALKKRARLPSPYCLNGPHQRLDELTEIMADCCAAVCIGVDIAVPIRCRQLEERLSMVGDVSEVAVLQTGPRQHRLLAVFICIAPHGSEAAAETHVEHVIRSTTSPTIAFQSFITERLPKDKTGKIARRILRKIITQEADSIGDLSTVEDPTVVEGLTNQVYEAMKWEVKPPTA